MDRGTQHVVENDRYWGGGQGSPIPALLQPTVLVSKRQGQKHLEPTAEPKSTVVPRNALHHHADDRLQAGWISFSISPSNE